LYVLDPGQNSGDTHPRSKPANRLGLPDVVKLQAMLKKKKNGIVTEYDSRPPRQRYWATIMIMTLRYAGKSGDNEMIQLVSLIPFVFSGKVMMYDELQKGNRNQGLGSDVV